MVFGKQEIYILLEQKGIDCEIIEHEAVYTMEDLAAVGLPCEENVAKNLFLRDGKKKNFFLVVVATESRIDLKALGEKLSVKGLSFASEKYLEEMMSLTQGAVSPFGVLNDKENRIKVYFDERFKDGKIAVHPNDNTASIYMNTADLVNLIREHGNELEYIKL